MRSKMHNTKQKKTNPIFNVHIHIPTLYGNKRLHEMEFKKYSKYACSLIYPHHF